LNINESITQNNSKISVLMPVYNAEDTVERAIESILAQTSPPAEIIVVDDGSTDRTVGILKKYGDRISLITQANSGAAAARNRAAQISQGRYLAFLDADDVWSKHKLEVQLKAFSYFPNAGISYTDCHSTTEKNLKRVMAENEKHVNVNCKICDKDFIDIFVSPCLGTPNVIISRQLFFEMGGFDENLIVSEDVDLWLRASFNSQCISIAEKLSYIVNRADSLTSTSGINPFKTQLQVIDSFCKRFDTFPKNNARVIRRAKGVIFEQWGSQALVDNNIKLSLKLLFKAIVLKPSFRPAYLFLKSLYLTIRH